MQGERIGKRSRKECYRSAGDHCGGVAVGHRLASKPRQSRVLTDTHQHTKQNNLFLLFSYYYQSEISWIETWTTVNWRTHVPARSREKRGRRKGEGKREKKEGGEDEGERKERDRGKREGNGEGVRRRGKKEGKAGEIGRAHV
jgi:hypothetical protein